MRAARAAGGGSAGCRRAFRIISAPSVELALPLCWCISESASCTSPAATAWALSWSVLAAGILQLAVVYLGVRHAGIRIGFKRPRFTPNVKRLLVLAVPAAVTGGITQINQLIGQAIASTKEGAISALQYADRIYQLPLGVVGVAVAVVIRQDLRQQPLRRP